MWWGFLSKLYLWALNNGYIFLSSFFSTFSAMILEPKKLKSATVLTVSPSVCYEVMGLDAMIFVFWMLSFKPTFSLSTRWPKYWSFSLNVVLPKNTQDWSLGWPGWISLQSKGLSTVFSNTRVQNHFYIFSRVSLVPTNMQSIYWITPSLNQ